MSTSPETGTSPARRTRRDRKKEINLEEKIFRLLAIVLFGFLLYFIVLGYFVLVAIQYVLYFIEDQPNRGLKAFTGKVRTYVFEIFSFMGFASDKLPFPFSPFPKK